jgi:peroxiredoxin
MTTATTLHELPVPSVFIIDATGTIRFVHKIRLGADALLVAAKLYATASAK